MKKCCISAIITLVVIIVILVVGVVVLLNMTPRQLKLGTVDFGGHSLEDYGLADVKLIKVAKGIRALAVKESDIVVNSYDDLTEAGNATAVFMNSTNFAEVYEYSGLLDQYAYFKNRYTRDVDDVTLAYIVNSACTNTESNYIAKDTYRVSELTVTKTVDEEGVGTGHMRIVVSVDMNSILDTAKEILSKAATVTEDSRVYVVCNADFTVATTGEHAGKLVFANCTSTIGNEEENVLSDLIFSLIAKNAGASCENVSEYRENLVREIFDRTAAVINHIGYIGKAATSSNDADAYVAGEINLGMVGVEEHKIKFVTANTLR